MNKYIEHKKECFLCSDSNSVRIKCYKCPCPNCSLANFLSWTNEQTIKTIQKSCVDCGDIVTKNGDRCYRCYQHYRETVDVLCDECGAEHHKAKFKRCYYCNLKKNLREV
jgi:hypothetical protein